MVTLTPTGRRREPRTLPTSAAALRKGGTVTPKPHRVLVEGGRKRQIPRKTRMHWRTLKKILEYVEPPGYRRS